MGGRGTEEDDTRERHTDALCRGWLQGQGGVALVTHVPSASQLDSFDESHTVGKLF